MSQPLSTLVPVARSLVDVGVYDAQEISHLLAQNVDCIVRWSVPDGKGRPAIVPPSLDRAFSFVDLVSFAVVAELWGRLVSEVEFCRDSRRGTRSHRRTGPCRGQFRGSAGRGSRPRCVTTTHYPSARTRLLWDEELSAKVPQALRVLGFFTSHVGHEGDDAPARLRRGRSAICLARSSRWAVLASGPVRVTRVRRSRA